MPDAITGAYLIPNLRSAIASVPWFDLFAIIRCWRGELTRDGVAVVEFD